MRRGGALTLRQLGDADVTAVLDMWVASWQAAYPSIDFAARRSWMQERLAEHRRDGAQCLVAIEDDAIVGLVVINTETHYLDQIAVDPLRQGTHVADALLAEAQRLSPGGFALHVNQDNARALRFYERHGLTVSGEGVNPRSGAPIFTMTWRP